MKISSDIIGNPNRNRPLVVQCLYRLRYGVFKCARGIEISCLLYNQIYITLFTWPAISLCVSVDICRSNLNISHLRSILILSSHLLIFHPNGVFVSGIPAIRLCSQFLSAIRATVSAHLVLDTTNFLFTPSLLWLMFPRILEKKNFILCRACEARLKAVATRKHCF